MAGGIHLTLIEPDPVEQAWEAYRKLALAATEDSRLWANREHCEATFRAHEAFRLAFIAQGEH